MKRTKSITFAVFFLLVELLLSQDITSTSVHFQETQFGADKTICIQETQFGADKTICIQETQFGADITYYVTEKPNEANKLIEVVNSSASADKTFCIQETQFGADKTICIQETQFGADITICIQDNQGGADESICILNATPREKEVIIALMSLYIIIPKIESPGGKFQSKNIWTTFEETSLKGTISGSIENGNIFQTISGNIYEVSEYIHLYEYEYNPDVTVLNKGDKYKLIIEGFDEPVICKLLENTAVGTNRYAPVSTGHWVSKKMNNGQFIVLEDNSKWEISSVDRIYTMLWLATESITVINRDGYYFLINSDCNNEKVMAIHLGN